MGACILFKRSKKGAYFFIIDVILGVFIFLATILLIATFSSHTPSMQGTAQTLDNVYTQLYLTQINDMDADHQALNYLEEQGFIPHQQLTLDELIFYLNHTMDNASQWQNATSSLLNETFSWLPQNYGLEFYIDDLTTPIYQKDSTIPKHESTLRLSRKKIIALAPDISFLPEEPVISEVVIWQ